MAVFQSRQGTIVELTPQEWKRSKKHKKIMQIPRNRWSGKRENMERLDIMGNLWIGMIVSIAVYQGRQWSDRVGNVLGTGHCLRSFLDTRLVMIFAVILRTFRYEIWSDVSNAQQNGIRSERNGSSGRSCEAYSDVSGSVCRRGSEDWLSTRSSPH